MTGPLNFEWKMPPGEPVAVAVSGGADSFALLHVLHEKNVPIVALTVDHGLRPEAADEAAKVAKWCGERNIPHETLVWEHGAAPSFETPPLAAPQDEASSLSPHPEEGAARLEGRGEKDKGNLQANARTARYRLLCEACNRLGLETLVTAHTADDQAETVFMRLRRGSGRGLAGMPETRLIAGGAGEPVTLYRPLLGLRRTATQSHAAAHDLPVSHDPSNEDDRFERVRVRALLAALEQQDLLTVDALCRTAEEIQVQTNVAEDACGRVVRPHPFTDDGSSIYVDRDTFDDFGGDLAAGKLIWSISGESSESVSSINLFELELPTTLGGVLLTRYIGNGWAFIREPAALLGRADGAGGFEPIPVKAGEKHLYDRRFIVHVPDNLEPSPPASSSEAVGQTKIRPLGALIPRDIATSTLDRQRISTLPCLTRGDALSHIPAVCQDFIAAALSGWKQAEAFLDNVGTFKADSLLEERFSGRVIRF